MHSLPSLISKSFVSTKCIMLSREIYVKTDIELTQDEVLRFKGFEVDVKKCVAALKGRGWGVSEDIGSRAKLPFPSLKTKPVRILTT